MTEDGNETIQVSLNKETLQMLEACAAWRKVSVEELVRDGPLGLDPETQQTTSRNWRDELLPPSRNA
jgi:hypothetical protein